MFGCFGLWARQSNPWQPNPQSFDVCFDLTRAVPLRRTLHRGGLLWRRWQGRRKRRITKANGIAGVSVMIYVGLHVLRAKVSGIMALLPGSCLIETALRARGAWL